jgi:hypothetical protein
LAWLGLAWLGWDFVRNLNGDIEVFYCHFSDWCNNKRASTNDKFSKGLKLPLFSGWVSVAKRHFNLPPQSRAAYHRLYLASHQQF